MPAKLRHNFMIRKPQEKLSEKMFEFAGSSLKANLYITATLGT